MISQVFRTVALASCAGLAFCAPSRADLLDLMDQPSASYSLSFTAGSTGETTISFAGYQNPAYEYVSQIGLFFNGDTSNLITTSWTHTYASSDAGYQDYDSFICANATSSSCTFIRSAVSAASPAIVFANPLNGDYDTWSQNVYTAPGGSYVLDFVYTNNVYNPGPSALQVTAVDYLSGTGFNPSVPEVSTWTMMLMGLAGLGAAAGGAGARRKSAQPLVGV